MKAYIVWEITDSLFDYTYYEMIGAFISYSKAIDFMKSYDFEGKGFIYNTEERKNENYFTLSAKNNNNTIKRLFLHSQPEDFSTDFEIGDIR